PGRPAAVSRGTRGDGGRRGTTPAGPIDVIPRRAADHPPGAGADPVSALALVSGVDRPVGKRDFVTARLPGTTKQDPGSAFRRKLPFKREPPNPELTPSLGRLESH